MHPDESLKNLSKIYDEFSSFCAQRGQVSEADTRVKIVDRILKEVLGGPETVIARENPVYKGYIDYTLAPYGGRNLVVVEAKREGIPFDMPIQKQTIHYRLNGAIKSNQSLYDAIEQAHYYCVEQGIKYAVVTNGYAWIVFRALREDIPWRQGTAIAFSSAGIVKKYFIEFWNTLAYDSVTNNGLETKFENTVLLKRSLQRVIDVLPNADALLTRNKLNNQINPIVNRIFKDIAENDQIEVLQRCYVHTKTLNILDKSLQIAIEDGMPRFVENEGAEDTTPGRFDAGKFGLAMKSAVSETEGSVFLMLGGIGAGKSTFLKRFFYYVGREFMDRSSTWFYIPFLHPPADVSLLEQYVYRSILDDIRSRYDNEELETRELLIATHQQEIDILKRTIWDAESLSDIEYQRRLSARLEEWMEDLPRYVQSLLSIIQRRGKAVVVCIDNVDQLSPEYQAQIFLLSQRIASELKAVTIVSLREESYYAASIQRTFTAYTNRKFHIASPDFRIMIGTRLRYAREVIKMPAQRVKLILKSGIQMEKDSVDHFLEIIEKSVFGHNHNIARFIESVSFGNMREALDMFASFLYSGSTDVEKMLAIYSKTGQYNVAFHEFAKAVMLEDRRFYRESQSKIANIFDVGLERNSSHFTALRLLGYLVDYRSDNTPEGRGYVQITNVLGAFTDIFDNEEDFIRTCNRLLKRTLIEVDTRETDVISYSSYLRVTAAGWYYANYLSRSFAYLDLILQDTPINSKKHFDELTFLVEKVDSIIDSEATKQEKLELRFKRVGRSLDYLEKEEISERKKLALDDISSSLGHSICEPIQIQVSREIAGIKRRLGNLFNNSDEEPESPELPGDLRSSQDDEESQNEETANLT